MFSRERKKRDEHKVAKSPPSNSGTEVVPQEYVELNSRTVQQEPSVYQDIQCDGCSNKSASNDEIYENDPDVAKAAVLCQTSSSVNQTKPNIDNFSLVKSDIYENIYEK